MCADGRLTKIERGLGCRYSAGVHHGQENSNKPEIEVANLSQQAEGSFRPEKDTSKCFVVNIDNLLLLRAKSLITLAHKLFLDIGWN